MKKVVLVFTLFYNIFASLITPAQTWKNVGIAGFSIDTANYPSMAIGLNDTPYIVYSDYGNSQKATVLKYNGSSWVNVGMAGFSLNPVFNTRIAINRSGVPYIAFEDSVSLYGQVIVMKYNGSGWVNEGVPGYTGYSAEYPCIAFDTSDVPYLFYSDVSYLHKATVMKYNGSSWVNVGTPGFSASIPYDASLAIDKSGTPYLAYGDPAYGNKVTVMKYNGSSWVNVGTPGVSVSGGQTYETSLAIDQSGTPYVAYRDVALTQKATVIKYNGSSWVPVGSAGFSVSGAVNTSIAIDGTGTPYIAFEDYAKFRKATVMKYNGSSWVNAGSPGFSGGQAYNSSIVMDGKGSPYVVYTDDGKSWKASVMSLELSPIIGTDSLCEGATITLSDTTSSGMWSSGNTNVATVGSVTGIMNGIAPGSVTISYTVSGISATFPVTILQLPNAGNIIGADTVCYPLSGFTVTILSDTATGGTWSSSNSHFSVSGGVVSDTFIIGIDTIYYIVSNTCGSDSTSYPINVVGCPDEIKIVTSEINKVALFPNPATVNLTISSTEKITSVTITNLIGQTVYNNNYHNEEVQVDVSGLAAGMYLVRVNGSEVRKFVKE
jgi:type IX secretion system substrate protein